MTLSPAASAAEILARIDTTSPGCSVKDSFGTLDLSGAGFDVLFEAEWIHRPPGPAPRHPDTDRTGVRWDVVRDADALAAWAAAWSGASGTGGAGGGPFRPELLGDGRTFVLRGRDGDRVVAGAVASRSAQAVGLSNVFAADGGSGAAWAGALGAVSERWPGLPVVGYESGEDLAAAVAHGCLPVGPLRVWLATDR
ncbi:hypothetical protein [Streptomyces pinistramenti]|uniref:hypothetical protein n=1 Tax=Streptomyces pinistramenti TaxID=2884812 RepID=UPI0027E57C2D|nr:hypothetical protein [Streptomyces pinistramenti]